MSQKYPEWYELPAKNWYRAGSSGVDSQKNRLYRAEDWAWEHIYQNWPKCGIPKVFRTEEEIAAFANKIFGSAWARRRFRTPWATITVTFVPQMRGGTFSSYSGMRLRGDERTRSALYVIHEVAHGLRPWTGHEGPSHGRWFARAYIELVGHLLGPSAAKELRAQFKAGKVHYTAHKQYSPEVLAEKRRQFQERVLQGKENLVVLVGNSKI